MGLKPAECKETSPKVLSGLPKIRANTSCAAAPCWPRALAVEFALLLPAHKGLASRFLAVRARAFLLSANRVIASDERMVQIR